MSGQVTDAMVERVARAICGAFGLKPDGKALHFTECDKEPLVENWRHYVQQARAAIEAASPQPQGVVGERKPLIGRLVFYRTCLMDEHDNSGAMLVDEAITRIQQLENAAHPRRLYT